MARSMIFGYSAEEEDGKLVITLTGSIAESLLHKYSAETIENNPNLISSLLPFARLGSPPVLLRRTLSSRKTEASAKLSLKEIFGQGFDRNKSEFESQLDAYRNILSDMKGKQGIRSLQNVSTRRGSRRTARKKRIKQQTAKTSVASG